MSELRMALMSCMAMAALVTGAALAAAGQPSTAPAPPASPATASAPATAPAASPTSAPATWPTDSRGLIWRTNDKPNRRAIAYDAAGKEVPGLVHQLKLQGLAVYGPGMSLRLEGGAFVDDKAGPAIAAATTNRELTIELLLAPGWGDGAIISLGPEGKAPAWEVRHTEEEALGLFMRFEGEQKLVKVAETYRYFEGREPGQPYYVIFIFLGNVVSPFSQGSAQKPIWIERVPAAAPADSRLVVGGKDELGRSGACRVLAAAVYGRSMTWPEIKGNRSDLLAAAAKATVPQTKVRAKLLAKSSLDAEPPHEGTYDRAWAVNEYEVEEVLAGKLQAKSIHVAQWVWVGRQYLAPAKYEVGETYELTLEPMDAHRELAQEMTYDDMEIDESVPRFHDVGPMTPLPAGRGS